MDLSGAVGLDESPSPPPESPSSLPGPRSPRSLFYGASQSEEETEELPLGTGEDGGAGSSTGDPWTDPESEFLDESEPRTSTGSPDGERAAPLLSKHQLRLTARAGVKTATGVTHTLAAKTAEAQHLGLYLADDEDCKAIGDPLADIAYRRGDLGVDKLSPDANDLIRSMMGVANYFGKQIAIMGEVRRRQAGQVAGDLQAFPTEVTS